MAQCQADKLWMRREHPRCGFAKKIWHSTNGIRDALSAYCYLLYYLLNVELTCRLINTQMYFEIGKRSLTVTIGDIFHI